VGAVLGRESGKLTRAGAAGFAGSRSGGLEPYRDFVTSSVGRKEGLQVVDEATDGLQAVEKARDLKLDLILLDIGPRKLHGIEAAREILVIIPEAKII
jgi:DNA-binding NarL/FixJ family response regulator